MMTTTTKAPPLKTSGIDWLKDVGGVVWNPTTGCTKGCPYCYANELVKTRLSKMPTGGYTGRSFQQVMCHPDRLASPFRHKKGLFVFVNSMGDLFDPAVPDDYINMVFGVMALANQHQYIIFTKFEERMQKYMAAKDRKWAIALKIQEDGYSPAEVAEWGWGGEGILPESIFDRAYYGHVHISDTDEANISLTSWPLPNITLGVSIEDQQTANLRIPVLLETPATHRAVSVEPLRGKVDFSNISGAIFNRNEVIKKQMDGPKVLNWEQADSIVLYPKIDWVIGGGMSGKTAEPTDPRWGMAVQKQCKEAGTPFYWKQNGEYALVAGWGENILDLGGLSPRTPDDGLEIINHLMPKHLMSAWGANCTIDELAKLEGVQILDTPQSQIGDTGEYCCDVEMFVRIGLKKTGHLLDGKECRQFPPMVHG